METKAPLLRKRCIIKTRSIRNFRLTLWFYANLLPFHDFTSVGAYSNIPEALSEGSFELWLHIMVMSRNCFFIPRVGNIPVYIIVITKLSKSKWCQLVSFPFSKYSIFFFSFFPHPHINPHLFYSHCNWCLKIPVPVLGFCTGGFNSTETMK